MSHFNVGNSDEDGSDELLNAEETLEELPSAEEFGLGLSADE
ncbi:hypothetical protein [Halosimplex amylolyticum]